MGNCVPFPFDVLSFVCFGDLCGDNANLVGQNLKTGTIDKKKIKPRKTAFFSKFSCDASVFKTTHSITFNIIQ